ncbi:Asp23/Gls24 family envelope stress response protein [Anaerotignum sp. MSJ-24]|uniref:Asp23/Gls24 family envelope stress response protein n=1 Tax=Anaerotignum sp. MSJ-24 TaxID=2841521 RepID=UPI001C10959F|nr:Asp23/Gls24 family envelope stress response protein [Anaerotignum sp. MSJ-24]MBD9219900.1 Asp23/Gls24 family envelope stress response protein [Clostridiales bacterium]MBU5463716.1 Asp23/Gls24 family envelope stress response protein [Anaerotignum sp. MSJ-24]
MSAKLENQYGTINIENEVIARIAGLTAIDCYGIVGMAAKNVKDDIFQLLKVESLTKGIKISVQEDRIVIDMHIIVEYGTNITAIAENTISTVKYKVETVCGINVEQVNVFVEGVRVDG